jgi:hypothetical protein
MGLTSVERRSKENQTTTKVTHCENMGRKVIGLKPLIWEAMTGRLLKRLTQRKPRAQSAEPKTNAEVMAITLPKGAIFIAY